MASTGVSAPSARGPRPYRDFLTPLLHQRFARAAGCTFLLCYVEAFVLGHNESWFWSLIPLSGAGMTVTVRALLLFISVLVVFILRVARLRIGGAYASSLLQKTKTQLWSIAFPRALVWYTFSAWWFGEVYIYSAPKTANIYWITETQPYKRVGLNERPIYLMTTFIIAAVYQTLRHVFFEYDRLPLPSRKSKYTVSASPIAGYDKAVVRAAANALTGTIYVVVGTPTIYSMLLRKTVWDWTLYFAKVVWNLPKYTGLPTHTPYAYLLLRTSLSVFGLLFIWEFTNSMFNLFMAEEPLKLGKVLTDQSKDANGSLISGLRSKKEVPRAFATWELVYISVNDATRRKSIFEQIDRKDGTTWNQVLESTIKPIEGVRDRVKNAISPPPPQTTPEPSSADEVKTLPKISHSLSTDNILAGSPRGPPVQTALSDLAKAAGNSPRKPGESPLPISPSRLLTEGKRHLSPSQQELLDPKSVSSAFNKYLLAVLKSPLGGFLTTSARSRSQSVIAGPSGDIAGVVDCVDALANLAVASLSEDNYGSVQKDVPLLIRTLTGTAQQLDELRRNPVVSWSDVELLTKQTSATDIKVDELETLLTSLREALQLLLETFGPYADNLGLSKKETREAREMIERKD